MVPTAIMACVGIGWVQIVHSHTIGLPERQRWKGKGQCHSRLSKGGSETDRHVFKFHAQRKVQDGRSVRASQDHALSQQADGSVAWVLRPAPRCLPSTAPTRRAEAEARPEAEARRQRRRRRRRRRRQGSKQGDGGQESQLQCLKQCLCFDPGRSVTFRDEVASSGCVCVGRRLHAQLEPKPKPSERLTSDQARHMIYVHDLCSRGGLVQAAWGVISSDLGQSWREFVGFRPCSSNMANSQTFVSPMNNLLGAARGAKA